MYKMNKKMEMALNELKLFENSIDYTIITEMTKTKFYEIEQCVLIDDGERKCNLDMKKIFEIYGDRIGYEASCNEFRINDYIEDDDNLGIKVLAYALEVMKSWESELKKQFASYTFNILISYDGEYATLRVYKYREEEIEWIDIDDLERFKYEAILVNIF